MNEVAITITFHYKNANALEQILCIPIFKQRHRNITTNMHMCDVRHIFKGYFQTNILDVCTWRKGRFHQTTLDMIQLFSFHSQLEIIII